MLKWNHFQEESDVQQVLWGLQQVLANIFWKEQDSKSLYIGLRIPCGLLQLLSSAILEPKQL